jgi:hypothetical protein
MPFETKIIELFATQFEPFLMLNSNKNILDENVSVKK